MSGADTSWLNNAFNNLGLTSEDMNKAMGAINAIDQSSIMGWQSLQDVFDNLGIEIGTQKLLENGLEKEPSTQNIFSLPSFSIVATNLYS